MPETKRYIGEILRRIARNQIDPRRAGLLLYGLQVMPELPTSQPPPTHSVLCSLGQYVTYRSAVIPIL